MTDIDTKNVLSVIDSGDLHSFKRFIINGGSFDAVGGKDEFVLKGLKEGKHINHVLTFLYFLKKDEKIEFVKKVIAGNDYSLFLPFTVELAIDFAEVLEKEEIFPEFVKLLSLKARASVALTYPNVFSLDDCVMWAIFADSYTISKKLSIYLQRLTFDRGLVFSKKDYWRISVNEDAVFCSDVIKYFMKKIRSGGLSTFLN